MSISLLVNDTLWADNVGQDCTSHPVTISPMQNIRNFHADYCELNRQFSLKLRVNQGGVN